jgi:FtsH-binding integral membrane protein
MTTIYGTPLQWVVMLAPLGIVFYLSARINHMSAQKAQTWFWIYSGAMGLSLAYIFLAYTGVSIARTLFITAGSFAGLSLYGYTTKRDLSGMRGFLVMGLIGIILASIVNIFMQSAGLHFAVTVIGVLVFAGLTAYDTQEIKNSYYQAGNSEHLAIMGALRLYLDFINLFIFLLQFLGDRR